MPDPKDGAANTSGIYDPQTGRWRKNPQGCNGVPDIIGFRLTDGVFVGVEIKAGRDTLRDDQKQFLNELKQAGGMAFVAHDFAGFVQSFEQRSLHTLATAAATVPSRPLTKTYNEPP